jgi:hypothetical protein
MTVGMPGYFAFLTFMMTCPKMDVEMHDRSCAGSLSKKTWEGL